MNWDEKIKMVQLGNVANESQEKMKDFYDYIYKNLPSFDSQAYEMLMTLLTLTEENVSSNLEFFCEIYKELKKFFINNKEFIIGVRFEFLKLLLERVIQQSFIEKYGGGKTSSNKTEFIQDFVFLDNDTVNNFLNNIK